MAFIVIFFLYQPVQVEGTSMSPRLANHERIFINKFVYRFEPPERGDIVVFKFMWQSGEHYVKRVVGLPGDRLRVVDRQVFVNGQPYAEPFVYHYDPERHFAGDDFPTSDFDFVSRARQDWLPELEEQTRGGELVVPPGRYFVMGDNRESSSDSRFWGFVPREVITGKPLLVYWSYETLREEYAMNSWADRIRQTFDLVFNFFSKTRWRRTFHWVR